MDLDTFTPEGGGSLSRTVTPRLSEPVATFTQTRAVHPDEIWSPRGSEIGPPQRPLTQPAQFYQSAQAERPAEPEYGLSAPHADAARMVRAVMRPGA